MAHYVLFVHGIGEQQPGDSAPFEDKIRRAFYRKVEQKRGAPAGAEALIWREAYWADLTQPDQEQLKARIRLGGLLRRFMIGSLGDAVAYSKLPYPPDKYGAIQSRFAETLSQLAQEAQKAGATEAPLTVVAHSLGTVIASDGLYDLGKNQQFPSPLVLHHFFTLGSPMALYGLRYGLAHFDKPLRPRTWVNFYYPQDVIGYPLKTLNCAYEEAVAEDVPLAPGGGVDIARGVLRWMVAKVPLWGALAAHGWYFSDGRVVDRVAAALAREV